VYTKNAVISTKSFEQPESNLFIYALLCPDTNIVKYIGKTTQGFNRIRQHYYDYKLSKSGRLYKKICWINKLRNENKIFKVKYLQYCDNNEQLNVAEMSWIKYYKDLGIELLNHTEGGEVTYRPVYTEEQKLLISKRTKEAMAKPEVRARSRESHLGKPGPNKGKTFDEEFSKKITAANYRRSKKIIDSEGNIYLGTKQVADKFQVNWYYISRRINTNKDINGITFKYLEDK